MRKISDIRIYTSNCTNFDRPIPLCNRSSLLFVKRIVMKLREFDFSLGEFDHLYINFTTCPLEEEIKLSDKPHEKWFQFYEYHVDEDLLQILKDEDDGASIGSLLELILSRCFAADDKTNSIIAESIKSAKAGSHMLARYMEKKGKQYHAELYLGLNDEWTFSPVLQVKDNEEHIIKVFNLKKCKDLGSYGNLVLKRDEIQINPKHSSYYEKRKPIILSLL